MLNDIKTALIECIKSSCYYALQLAETTNVADLAIFLTYIRYEYAHAAQDDYLFCPSLETRTTAKHIFQLLDEFV